MRHDSNTKTRPAAAAARGPLSANDKCWCDSGKKYKRCHRDEDEGRAQIAKLEQAARALQPGVVSPRREVPPSIPRPDYAETGRPSAATLPDIKDAERIDRMRKSCRAAAELLQLAGSHIRPGVTTDEIDAIVHEETLRRGGYPSTLNYRNFPKSLCTSVNEVICHGIPDSRALREGDIVNLDITIFLHGMHGDCSATFEVGKVDPAAHQLVEVTRECLLRGVAAVRPGGQVRDIGAAIENKAKAHGYSVVRSYCGHGIGETFHTRMQIPHYHDARATVRFVPGMTFTIEPMINEGVAQDRLWSDGWTVVTADGRRSAQFEHTVLVTPDGVEILTRLD